MQKPGKKQIIRAIGAVLVSLAATAIFMLFINRFSTWEYAISLLVSVPCGILLSAAVFRYRYFVQISGVFLALVVVVSLTRNFLGYGGEQGEQLIFTQYVQSGTAYHIDHSYLGKEMGVFRLMQGKTVYSQADCELNHMIGTFAEERVDEAIDLPAEMAGNADEQTYCTLSRLIDERLDEPTEVDEEEENGRLYIWYEGLEEAETLVVVDIGNFNFFVMSLEKYGALKSEVPLHA